MAVPGFRAASFDTVQFDQAVDRPAGTAEGDLLVALVTCLYSDALITPPAGWELQEESVFDPETIFNSEWAIYTKVVGASEGSSDTWEISEQGGGNQVGLITIGAFTGNDLAVDLCGAYVNSGDDPLVIPSITTTGTDRLLIAAVGASQDEDTATISGMTVRSANFDGSVTGHSQLMFSESRASAGATGTRSCDFSGTTYSSYGCLLAIYESGGGAPPASLPPRRRGMHPALLAR